MNKLSRILFFEASPQVWMKKFQIPQEKAEEYLKEFERNKASIYQKDITRYKSFKDIANVITTVARGREVYNLKSNVLLWLTKIMFDNPNIKAQEDYFPALIQYQKNKNILPPIESFNNINDLVKAFKSTKEKQFSDVKPEQEDKFYSINGWDVFMPHTTKASCKLGQGTTWCTARTDKKTEGENYFVKYTVDGGFILFYVIRQQPENDSYDELSIGYNTKTQEFEWGEDGHVTVNSENVGLEYDMFSSLVGGDSNADLILSAMKQKAQELKNKPHPATQEFYEIGQDINKFIDHFQDFDGFALGDVVRIVKNTKISLQVAEYILENIYNLSYASKDGEKIPIEGFVFSNKNYKNSLREVSIKGCTFEQCEFFCPMPAELIFTKFDNCHFSSGAKFSYGSIQNTEFDFCSFVSEQSITFVNVNMYKTQFSNCEIEFVWFGSCDIFNSKIESCFLKDISFDDTTQINSVNFNKSTFDKINFSSAKLDNVNFSQITINNCELDTLYSNNVIYNDCKITNSLIIPIPKKSKITFLNTTIDNGTIELTKQTYGEEQIEKFRQNQPGLILQEKILSYLIFM